METAAGSDASLIPVKERETEVGVGKESLRLQCSFRNMSAR